MGYMNDPDVKRLEELLSFRDGKKAKVVIKGEQQPLMQPETNIIAFNYIWPQYGFSFIETSIQSILPFVKKYILFLNRFSYVGTECDPANIQFIKDICSRYDKVEVIYNDSPDFDERCKNNNIGYYINEMMIYCTALGDNSIKYIWLVQSDEVYDFKNASSIYGICMNEEIKDSLVIQPMCYVDNPHWVVNPPENFTRPTIIRVGSEMTTKDTRNDIIFHHLSYVMRKNELGLKFDNWGHRDDMDIHTKRSFYLTMDHAKTDKSIRNFHPIAGNLYATLQFTDNEVSRRLFGDWIYDLVFRNNQYEVVSDMFMDKVCDLPQDPSRSYLLTEIERRFVSAVATEMLPTNGTFLEIGSFSGWNLIMIQKVAPGMKVIGIDPYNDPDSQMQMYQNLSFVYPITLRNLMKNDMLYKITIMRGTAKHMLPILQNNSLDAVFIDSGRETELYRSSIIEVWPKVKDYGIMFGHDYNIPQVKEAVDELIHYDVQVNCPWGTEMFNFYEIYYNVFDLLKTGIAVSRGVPMMKDYGIWFARVRKS